MTSKEATALGVVGITYNRTPYPLMVPVQFTVVEVHSSEADCEFHGIRLNIFKHAIVHGELSKVCGENTENS